MDHVRRREHQEQVLWALYRAFAAGDHRGAFVRPCQSRVAEVLTFRLVL